MYVRIFVMGQKAKFNQAKYNLCEMILDDISHKVSNQMHLEIYYKF